MEIAIPTRDLLEPLQQIFEMESAGNEGWNSPTVDEAGDAVTVTSFEGVTLYPRLARLPGKEREDVLLGTSASTEEPSVVEGLIAK